MKITGKKDLDATTCGFTPTGPDDPICGGPAVIHAMIEDTWELISFASACAEHAPALRYVADYTHDTEPPCLTLDRRFFVRTDGSSFCYIPEDDADLQARITRPDIAFAGPLT